MEFEWSTLQALADHKRGYRAVSSAKREYKIELWLLFPTQDRKRGQATLDLGVAFESADATYHHEPPWEPPTPP